MTTRGKLSEAGCFSPPAVRPRLRRREPKSEVQIPQVLKILIGNRRIQPPPTTVGKTSVQTGDMPDKVDRAHS
jgi:hypothetical protein